VGESQSRFGRAVVRCIVLARKIKEMRQKCDARNRDHAVKVVNYDKTMVHFVPFCLPFRINRSTECFKSGKSDPQGVILRQTVYAK
jgi:hypothetical protein